MKNLVEGPSVAMILRTIAPFHRRAGIVVIIVIGDNLLASLGIGMIFPIIQTMVEQDPEKIWLVRHFPSFTDISPQARLILVTLMALGLFVLKFIIGLIRVAAVRDLGERLRKYWSVNIGRNILFGSYQHFISKNQGVWLNDWLTEPLCASRFYLSYIQYLSSSLMVVGLFVLGMAVNWRVMLGFSMAIGVVILITQRLTFSAAADHSRNKSYVIQKLSSNISESLGHIKDIKVLNAEELRIAEMGGYFDRLRGLFVRAEVLGELPRLSGELMAVMALVFSALIMTAIPGLTVSEVLPTLALFFVVLYRLLTASTSAMAARIRAWQEYHSVKLVDALTREDTQGANIGTPIQSVETDIVFKDVSFAYDVDRPVFKCLNITVPRGSYIHLIGQSGAGKTTFLDLLLRLVQPQKGSIEVNGQNIESFSLYDWRDRMGYVNQDAALFFGTIRSNILLGKKELAEADLDEACRRAGCYDFIQSLPQGYDTMVGQRGHALSGGQRKRIAIARALVGHSQFLILDEATTSFQTSIETDIVDKLRAHCPDLTIILVSHRLSGFSDPDITINIEGGDALVTHHRAI